MKILICLQEKNTLMVRKHAGLLEGCATRRHFLKGIGGFMLAVDLGKQHGRTFSTLYLP